ncbi:MAG: beta-lactamase family protein [Anaerolineales bacterium]|nr:beta-lactamase family protein [Anaerolineales bacterium]
MKQYHLPSMGVSLIDDQDIVWQEAFGMANIELNLPATVDTVYKLWSVSKVFTAMEVMRLVEDGLVDLDAPITDYLPDFSIQSRCVNSEPITIRSILAHHAGLPRNGCHRVQYSPEDRNVLGILIASLEDCHQTFPVGNRYSYSNIGFDTLGYLIEELRGVSFAPYMKNNLLSPIGMENSTFVSTGIPEGLDVAPGYEYNKNEYYPYEQADISNLPSGNLYSTIADMSDFVRFLFQADEQIGVQIIRDDTLTMMFENQYLNTRDPQPMGLGWKTALVLGSELLVWHDGGPSEGIGSLVAMLPERKLGVVLFANEISFEGGIAVSLAIEMLERMLETKFGIVSPENEEPEQIIIESTLLNTYVGEYIAFGEDMQISLRGDQLKGSFQGMTFDLIPVDATRFRLSHWLLNIGLADLLQVPIDLQKLEIEFFVGDEAEEDLMIVNISNLSYQICPKLPEIIEIPVLWDELAGDYEIVHRLPSGNTGGEIVGRSEIWIEDGVLMMPNPIGPIKPISADEIVILGGIFAGETMVYEPATGIIYHQSNVYRPTESD